MALDSCGITGIDHTLVGVRDLEAARAAWARLGFTITPRGRHIGWGTGNYCVMLEEGYVELLGIVDPSQFSNNLDKLLEKREGLLGLAFATPDANACRDALEPVCRRKTFSSRASDCGRENLRRGNPVAFARRRRHRNDSYVFADSRRSARDGRRRSAARTRNLPR
jgi:hypothetical protein